MGVILGTAAYLSPEQARGEPVDKRADVWSFGVALYEMLTGQRAFQGEDVSTTLADVIRGELKRSALPAELPPVLASYLHRCVEKDPSQRVRDIGDMRLAMEGAFETNGHDAETRVVTSPTLRAWQRPGPAAGDRDGVVRPQQPGHLDLETGTSDFVGAHVPRRALGRAQRAGDPERV